MFYYHWHSIFLLEFNAASLRTFWWFLAVSLSNSYASKNETAHCFLSKFWKITSLYLYIISEWFSNTLYLIWKFFCNLFFFLFYENTGIYSLPPYFFIVFSLLLYIIKLLKNMWNISRHESRQERLQKWVNLWKSLFTATAASASRI